MMDNTSWMAPPGAAQPTGILSTAGAVPVVNEKGEVSMKKVKVSRYISGKRPDYAPVSSDEDLSDGEDFTQPKGGNSPQHKSLTETELQDRRLRRLLTSKSDRIQQRGTQAEVVEVSKVEADVPEPEPIKSTEFGRAVRIAESDSESDDDVDEEELLLRRQRMREKALQKSQEEQEVLGKEEEGSEESSEEESSEYTEESDSEEEGPRLKPVFVRKKDRVTIHQKEIEYNKEKQLEIEAKKRAEERRRETLRMIESEHRRAQPAPVAADGTERNLKVEDINTDDEADDAEYEAWKLRELKRIKRDKEEREQTEKEKEEIEKLRSMTEEERRIALRNNPKVVTNKAFKGKYKFMQKYYHRGAFFLNEEENVFRRDFSGATLDDHFDKTILPKVMQVKNFGRSGRTKYTHLVDQDTTSFDSAWFADSHIKNKFSNSCAGGMKQVFERPSAKRKTVSTSESYSTKRAR